MAALEVEFCGQVLTVPPGDEFTIGREGTLAIADNPYLHRQMLHLAQQSDMWTLSNVGSRLAATLVAPDTRLEAHIVPGASLPLVFERSLVSFAAGSTHYEVEIRNPEAAMRAVPTQADVAGETTLRGVLLNQEQRLLLVALAESRLRSDGLRPSTLPASKEAAGRLGWTVTKFNRKLDHLCQVLTKSGVRGLHGGPGELASQRRARLVQHAIASGMVTAEHLSLLP